MMVVLVIIMSKTKYRNKPDTETLKMQIATKISNLKYLCSPKHSFFSPLWANVIVQWVNVIKVWPY